MPKPLIMSGPRAIFKINDQIVAFASNVTYRIAQPLETVTVFGRYSPARHEPVGYDVQVSCNSFRYASKGGKGNAPDSKNLNQRIAPALNDIINSDELKIEIIDRLTDETILVVHRARLSDRNGTMSSRGLLSESWSFQGVVAESSDSGAQAESSGTGSTLPNTQAAQ